MDATNLQVLRESFGRVVYTHKTHEKAADIESMNGHYLKWLNVILTTLTSGSVITNLISNQTCLYYASAILSTLTLAVVIFQLSFNPEENATRHRQTAKELWFVRESYVNLLVDVKNKTIDEKEIVKRRDDLINQLKFIYKFAPQTNSKAYEKAQKALKVSEDLTFSDEEINHFLPKDLHI